MDQGYCKIDDERPYLILEIVDWVTLKYLKQSNSIELAEYSVANEIIDEPAFNWLF